MIVSQTLCVFVYNPDRCAIISRSRDLREFFAQGLKVSHQVSLESLQAGQSSKVDNLYSIQCGGGI